MTSIRLLLNAPIVLNPLRGYASTWFRCCEKPKLFKKFGVLADKQSDLSFEESVEHGHFGDSAINLGVTWE